MHAWISGLSITQTVVLTAVAVGVVVLLVAVRRVFKLARRVVWRAGLVVVVAWVAGIAPTLLAGLTTDAGAPPATVRAVTPSPPATVDDPGITISPTDALSDLTGIPIKGRAPMTGYTSDETFWGMWGTQPGGCDTRNFILGRDMTVITMKAGSNCLVQTGILDDPYTGKTINFTRGGGSNYDGGVQIDHVVARANAWATGAFAWTPDQRVAFANDPLELLAADATANQQKGSGDAATWLPSNKAFRCEYVTTQVEVKTKYGLWMTQAEHDTIQTILKGC